MATIVVPYPLLRECLTRRDEGPYFDPYIALEILGLLSSANAGQKDDTRSDGFEIMLNVRHFLVHQINIRVDGRKINISCKHPVVKDSHGQIERSFVREIQLPENVNPELVTAHLELTGILILKAPLSPSSPTRLGREVKVEVQQPINPYKDVDLSSLISIPIGRISVETETSTQDADPQGAVSIPIQRTSVETETSRQDADPQGAVPIPIQLISIETETSSRQDADPQGAVSIPIQRISTTMEAETSTTQDADQAVSVPIQGAVSIPMEPSIATIHKMDTE